MTAVAVLNRLNILSQTAESLAESQDAEAANQRSFTCMLTEGVSILREIFNYLNTIYEEWQHELIPSF